MARIANGKHLRCTAEHWSPTRGRRTVVRQRIHNGEEEVVDEDHANDRASCLLDFRLGTVRTSFCPTSEHARHANEGDQVLCPAAEDRGQEGNDAPCNQVLASGPEVYLVLDTLVGDTDCGQDFRKTAIRQQSYELTMGFTRSLLVRH